MITGGHICLGIDFDSHDGLYGWRYQVVPRIYLRRWHYINFNWLWIDLTLVAFKTATALNDEQE
jgi:hypothetical protein